MSSSATGPVKLAIVGAGGHATSLLSVAMAAGFLPVCCIDPSRLGSTLLGVPILGSLDVLSEPENLAVAIAIGDNAIRQRVWEELNQREGRLSFPAIRHPSAVVASGAQVGEGSVLMPLCVVGPNSVVGRFTILNTKSSIDHDCLLDDFASLAPSATTGGSVQIGARSAISIGATVRERIRIGQDVLVGGQSFVNNDLPDNVLAYGVPAKTVRKRERGERYL